MPSSCSPRACSDSTENGKLKACQSVTFSSKMIWVTLKLSLNSPRLSKATWSPNKCHLEVSKTPMNHFPLQRW